MRYVTENSTYDVRFSDPPMVRRVSGRNYPSARFAGDTDWHEARAVISSDKGLTILWPNDPTGRLRNATVTSPVRYAEAIDESEEE